MITGASARAQPAMLLRAGVFVDGAARDATGDRVVEHVDPATGKALLAFALGGREDVEAVVASSVAAFEGWRAIGPYDRRQHLLAIAAGLRASTDELAAVYALESGAPISFGRLTIEDAARWFEYYAGWVDKIAGDTLPTARDRDLVLTLREPLGVVAAILSSSNPIANIAMCVPAMLAAGCTAVIKPAEQAPFTAMRFAKLCADAGLPDGVVNVLVGDRVAGEVLVAHPAIAKIAFTGGPQTARAIQRTAAENLTPLLLELGGKSANIVFADANIDAAVAFSSIITAVSGQGCSLPTRLLVEEAVADDVIGRLAAIMARVQIGDPFDAATEMGPVVNAASCERILAMVETAVSSNHGTLHLGGKRVQGALSGGFFVEPTLLVDVDPSSAIAQTEIFGPVLAVTRFRTPDEALELANATPYGLAAYVHTRDISRALTMARGLRAGGIGINGKLVPSGYDAPFGGVGLSGFGREGGREGLEEFLYTKNVAINLGL